MPTRLLVQDIVAASREPLLVLDEQLNVLAASRSFCTIFGISEQAVVGSPFAGIGGSQWDIPLLAEQLDRMVSGGEPPRDYEVALDLASGRRLFLLHASTVGDADRGRALMLAMEDLTERRRIEAEGEQAVARASNMLIELNHRVMNSLAMIGAILTMEGQLQPDDGCRAAFLRMRSRITSIAHLYRTLGRDSLAEAVRSDDYLKNIVDDLTGSLSDPTCKVEVSLSVAKMLLPAQIAVPLGLIVNELVTNSLKHAFIGRTSGAIGVEFTPAENDYVLRISDNGRGFDADTRNASGLGQRLSDAFAQQLRGTVEQASGPGGTTVVLRFPRIDAR